MRIQNDFGRSIHNGKITLTGADESQTNLLVEIIDFKKKAKAQNPEKNKTKKIFLITIYTLWG